MLRTHFEEHGFVRLEGAFAANAPALADVLWTELRRRHGILREAPGTWHIREPRGLGAVRRASEGALATAAVREAIDELVGDHPEPFSWGDPLVTFPEPGRWEVPTTGWHIDFPARSRLRLKWLGYLEPVARHGGGTVVLAGSHRLVAEALRTLAPADPGRSPTIRDLVVVDRLDTTNVVELTGKPGDVVFLHPHLFHAAAPNRGRAPRLMVTGGLAG